MIVAIKLIPPSNLDYSYKFRITKLVKLIKKSSVLSVYLYFYLKSPVKATP